MTEWHRPIKDQRFALSEYTTVSQVWISSIDVKIILANIVPNVKARVLLDLLQPAWPRSLLILERNYRVRSLTGSVLFNGCHAIQGPCTDRANPIWKSLKQTGILTGRDTLTYAYALTNVTITMAYPASMPLSKQACRLHLTMGSIKATYLVVPKILNLYWLSSWYHGMICGMKLTVWWQRDPLEEFLLRFNIVFAPLLLPPPHSSSPQVLSRHQLQ